jgi:hypothetical protein
MFETLSIAESRPIAILKKSFLIIIIALLGIGAVSSYRAYVQVRSLELDAGSEVREGTEITASVVTSGRTTVDVVVELVQGSHSETLFVMHVRGNELAFFDPRSQQKSQTMVATNDQLRTFDPGPAIIRATATGRPQWTRLPPPTVIEKSVEIHRN